MEVKSVGTFSVILVKVATSPVPPQTKLSFFKWVEITAFFGAQYCLGGGGGGGGGGVGPKAAKKIVIRGRVLRTFSQSQVIGKPLHYNC